VTPTAVLGLALGLGLAAGLGAEPKIALFGSFPQEKCLEVEAAQKAVDAANAVTTGPRLRLQVLSTGNGASETAAAAERLVADPDVLAVVVHGEAGVSPQALAVFQKAHLGVIAASSWITPRPAEVGPTWLCPGLDDISEDAALYARREVRAKSPEAAVVDDGTERSHEAARAFAARFRALGGKIKYEGAWSGDEDGLAATVKGLATHLPQMVFYSGAAEDAGRLVVAMKGDKALRNADLIGLPYLFDPAFFSTTGTKGMRTRALFPCPDYDGMGQLVQDLGFAFPKTSPEWRAYVQFAHRHPGRWSSMIYDGVALAARALRAAEGVPLGTAAPASVTGAAQVSPTAQAGVGLSGPAQTIADPGREDVRLSLLQIESYRGIRGNVRFGASREPVDSKVEVYFALNRVNTKDLFWKQHVFGPPFYSARNR